MCGLRRASALYKEEAMCQYPQVRQEDEWGCGVACVAARLGISYDEARARLEHVKGNPINMEPKGLELDPIVHVLHEANVHVVADWYADDFPPGTIVYISGEPPYEWGHYLLKVAQGWMDPWANMPRQQRKAGFIDNPPHGTRIVVALIPKPD